MNRKKYVLTVVASMLMAACASGEKHAVGGEPLARADVGVKPAVTLTPPHSSRPKNVRVEVFRQANVHDVFLPLSEQRWPAAGMIVSRFQTHSLPPPISRVPTKPLSMNVPFAMNAVPERVRVPPPVDRWDASSVRWAKYDGDEPVRFGATSRSVRLVAADQDEPLPPPIPVDLEWFGEDEANDVTLGEIEVIRDLLDPDGILQDPVDLMGSGMPMPNRTLIAVRVGYWAADYTGSPVKVGEYQSLKSSMFLDFEGLHTDGLRTWDFYGSVLDNDAQQAGVRFYGPIVSGRFDYQGYLRRLDRDPFSEFVDFDRQPARPLPGPPENYRDMKEDLTVGDDFAIRVQELDTSFSGRLTDHMKWRLNVWGMRKQGERQASAMAHCFTAPNATDTNGNPVTGQACHILSQSQRIDWLTAEIEPVIEAKFGPVTAEYSRTMRTLTTNDQIVTRPYDQLGLTGELPYAVVPENYTAIDRLKVGFALPEHRDGYVRLYSGRTHNEFRDIDRDFRGFDLRLTDRSIDGVTVSAYAKKYVQEGESPRFLLDFEDAANIRAPINYDRTTAGVNATWRPFYDEWSLRSRLRFSSGYEYRELERENAIFEEQAVTADNSFTTTNRVHMRASMNWTQTLKSYVRYRVSFIDNPLYAVPTQNTTVNTSLPTQIHSIQFGNTWSPSHSLFLHGLLGLNNSWNRSEIANFREDDYDLVFTAWYAPTVRWSLSGGLAFYSNWIDQDITLGSKLNPSTLPWDYGGQSDVINLGTTYAWTQRMTLSSTIDFVRGRNAFGQLNPWPDLWTYSDVNVETTRLAFGIDYDLASQSTLYFRYQLFDYDDKSALIDGGTSEMYLFGINAFF